MIASDDVRRVTFDRAMRGYRCEDVDDYLKQVADSIDSLAAENDDLQKKLVILAQRIDQYRADEDTLSTTMINAQRLGENVIKEAMHMLDEHPDTKLYVVGEYGRHFFTQHNIPMEHSFLYTAQNPTMQRAREICDILLEGYDRGDFKKIFVIYTDMENSLTSSAHCTRLLPFHRAYFQTDTVEKAVTTPFEFVPSVQAVLNNIMQSYVSGFIYSALIDSFCSEQNARMTAMDSANSNAEKLLAELSLQYNRVRQAAITQEITEISAGAKAQRRKHRKEA